MKIKSIFIGDLNDYTESKSKHDAFRDIGWDITSWSTVPIPTYPGLGSSNSLLRRAARKILPMEDLTGVNAWLSKMAKSGELGNFDVVWSDKAINVKPRILRRIRAAISSRKTRIRVRGQHDCTGIQEQGIPRDAASF